VWRIQFSTQPRPKTIPGFVGTDRLTYSVSDRDGILSNSSTVTITVNNEERSPENQINEASVGAIAVANKN
jgi:hypothetical protein